MKTNFKISIVMILILILLGLTGCAIKNNDDIAKQDKLVKEQKVNSNEENNQELDVSHIY